MMKHGKTVLVLTFIMLFTLNGCAGKKQEASVNESESVETAIETEDEANRENAIETSIEPEKATTQETEAPDPELTLQQELEQLRGEKLQFDQPIFETAQRLYTLEELREMSDDALSVFRNELYARHGRIFNGEKWKQFFEPFSWYEGQYSAEQFYEQQVLSELEKENLKQVLTVESERKDSVTFTLENYPRVDGSTATIPLSEQFAADAMELPIEEARLYILHNKTHRAYENLIAGRADIIFVTAPSQEELQLAEEAGMELEIHPVVKEAFVFLVNEQNTVKSLTQNQIKDIYSGKIQNWKEVGGEDEPMLAYQRPVNSGSQSGMLSIVMKDTPIMTAPTEFYPTDMDGLVETVLSYDNAGNAIGYSYYYYVSSMYFRKGIRLMAIDGVEPNEITIQDDSYPYTTSYYAVIKKSETGESSARKLLQWIEQSGKGSIEKAGYVPLK